MDFCKTLGCSVLENGNCGQKSEIKPRIPLRVGFFKQIPRIPVFIPDFLPRKFCIEPIEEAKNGCLGPRRNDWPEVNPQGQLISANHCVLLENDRDKNVL